MQKVKLKDGTYIVVPPNLTKEERAELQEIADIDTLGDVGRSSLSGLAEGAVRAPFIFGDLLNLGARGLNKVRPGTVDPTYEKLTSDRAVEIAEDATGLNRHQSLTDAGRYANAGSAALGGTLALGPLQALKVPGAAARLPGIGTAAGQAASRLLRTPAVTAPLVGMAAQGGADLAGPAGGLAGGVGSQVALSLLARGVQPNHPDWIREGTRSMGPDDWTTAFANRKRLEDAGATSATLADAMPDNSQLRGFTRDLSNTSGGAALTQALAARNTPGTQQLQGGQLAYPGQGEIPRLLDEASDAISPAVNTGAVTDQVSGAAEELMRGARENRFQQYNPILEGGAPVPRKALAQQLAMIRAQGRLPQNRGTVDQSAAQAAASALRRTPLGPVPPFTGPVPPALRNVIPEVRNLAALSKNVKGLKDGVPTAGMPLDKAAGYNAYKMADQSLRNVSPEYQQAMDLYKRITEQTVEPMEQGLVGQLAKLQGLPPSEKQLGSVILRSTPEEIKSTLPQVAQSPASRAQLARVLADQVKKPLGQAGASAESVQKGRQAVVDLVDPAVAGQYSLKTGAADTLAKLTAEAGADATARQGLSRSTLGALAAPFLEFRNKMRLKLSEQETLILADLLSKPTEKNMKLLQQIAQERPEAGQMLRSVQILGRTGVAVTSTQEK